MFFEHKESTDDSILLYWRKGLIQKVLKVNKALILQDENMEIEEESSHSVFSLEKICLIQARNLVRG